VLPPTALLPEIENAPRTMFHREPSDAAPREPESALLNVSTNRLRIELIAPDISFLIK